MKIMLLSLVLMVCYNLNVLVSGIEYKALVFNQKPNPSLISVPETGSLPVKCNTWVTACPATTKDEKKFNETYSFYNGALFIKNVYNENYYCADVQKDRCREPYKLSMAWFKEAIEFGYEIYFERDESANSKFDLNDASIYEDFESLKSFLEVESLSFMDKLRAINLLRKSNTGETTLMLKDRRMEFIWIPLFKLWFNANRLRKIEYQIRQDNVSPTLQCADYSLGKELIHNVDVDKLYSKDHQKERLNGLSIPPKSAQNGCEEEYKCLTKWSLIPSDQFQFATDPSSTPKCSNIATVPIWKSTLEEILEKLDVYLYTLSRVSGEPLRIVAGVSGALSLPRSSYFVLNIFVSLVDTETKFSIRAPNIIYKIVKIKTNKCQVINNTCWYGVLIVIHNNPHFDGQKPICDDVTEDWGWWGIKYGTYIKSAEEQPSKFIYACKITRKSIEAVGLTYRHDMIIDDLSLKRFPIYEGEEIAYAEMDIKVNNELERITKLQETINIEDEVIERPPIYDEDFDIIQSDPDETASEDGEGDQGDALRNASLKKAQ